MRRSPTVSASKTRLAFHWVNLTHSQFPPSLQVNSLNSKVRNLKRDKEETEGELETSKSRMRQLRAQLEDAEESASSLQTQITKLRSANRKKVRV